MTHHVHHDLIIAWAKGHKVQQKITDAGVVSWLDLNHPLWDPLNTYRLKPEPEIDVGYIAIDTGWNIGIAYDSIKYAKERSNLNKPIECVIKITRSDNVTTSVELVKE